MDTVAVRYRLPPDGNRSGLGIPAPHTHCTPAGAHCSKKIRPSKVYCSIPRAVPRGHPWPKLKTSRPKSKTVLLLCSESGSPAAGLWPVVASAPNSEQCSEPGPAVFAVAPKHAGPAYRSRKPLPPPPARAAKIPWPACLPTLPGCVRTELEQTATCISRGMPSLSSLPCEQMRLVAYMAQARRSRKLDPALPGARNCRPRKREVQTCAVASAEFLGYVRASNIRRTSQYGVHLHVGLRQPAAPNALVVMASNSFSLATLMR